MSSIKIKDASTSEKNLKLESKETIQTKTEADKKEEKGSFYASRWLCQPMRLMVGIEFKCMAKRLLSILLFRWTRRIEEASLPLAMVVEKRKKSFDGWDAHKLPDQIISSNSTGILFPLHPVSYSDENNAYINKMFDAMPMVDLTDRLHKCVKVLIRDLAPCPSSPSPLSELAALHKMEQAYKDFTDANQCLYLDVVEEKATLKEDFDDFKQAYNRLDLLL